MQFKSLGFNMPTTQTVEPNSPTVDAQTNTSALDALNQGQQLFGQALQQSVQTSQRLSQSNIQSLETLEANSRAVSQAAIDTAKASALTAGNFAESLSGVGKAVQQQLDYQTDQRKLDLEEQEKLQKLADAAAKAKRQKNKVRANERLLEEQQLWIEQGQFDKFGRDPYHDRMSGILAQYELEPDDLIQLTDKYVGAGLEYAKRVEGEKIQQAKDLVLQQREINKAQLTAPLSATMAKLSTSDGMSPAEVDNVWNGLTGHVDKIMADERFPILDRAEAVATIMEEGLKRMTSSNEAYYKAKETAKKYKEVAAYAAQQQSLLVSGAKGYQETQDEIKRFAIERGLPDYTLPDPNASIKFVADAKSAQSTVDELSRKKALTDVENLAASNAIISGLAIDAVASPASMAELRRAASEGTNVNAKAALDYAERFTKFKSSAKQDYDAKRLGLVTQAQQVVDDFNLWFINATKPAAAASLSPDLSRQLEILRGARIDTPEAQLTPQQKAERVALIQQSKNAIIQSYNARINQLDTAFRSEEAEFAQMGLFLNVDQMKAARASVQSQIESYQARLREIENKSTQVYEQGLESSFRYGTQPTLALSRRSYGGKQIVMPFEPAVAKDIPAIFEGQTYGAPRDNDRTHDGLDFAVPSGTRLLALVGGTVRYIEPDNGKKGYGLNIEVQGDDGLYYHYAHLSGTLAVEGQRVEAGQPIALSGESGSPGSQHLHLGVYKRDAKGAFTGAIDPLVHLSTHDFSKSSKKPRAAASTTPMLPKGAIPLGNNKFMLNGKLMNLSPGVVKQAGSTVSPLASLTTNAKPASAKAAYNTAAPLKESWVSNRASDFVGKKNPPDWHHNYAALQRDPALAREINRVANKYGMPGVWLADVIAYESANTFSTSVTNEWGYVGLIQFGNEVMKDLGVTAAQLKSLTPAQQMKYVDAYLGLRLKQSGVKAYKGPEWLVAGINQGNVGIQQVDRYGEKAVLDPENRDGAGTTLLKYMQTLGKFSGRQYDFLGNRKKRVSSVIHDRPRHNCATCIALNQSQQVFIAHESGSTLESLLA